MAEPPGNPVAHLTEYELHYLVEHLESSGRIDDAHRLLALEADGGRNAWYEVRAAAGDTTRYLSDVARMWRQAELENDLALQVKYALCQASVIALSVNVPSTLLALALKHNVMSHSGALGIVRTMPDDLDRGEALASIAPYLPAPLVTDALSLALHLAPGYRQRTQALAALAPYVPDKLLTDAVLEELSLAAGSVEEGLGQAAEQAPFRWQPDTLVAVNSISSWDFFRKTVSAEVGQFISLDSLSRVLDVVLSIEDEIHRIFSLIELTPYLTPDLASTAFFATVSIEHRDYREELLAKLATLTSPEAMPKLLRQVLAAVSTIKDDWQRAVVLTHLAKYLSPNLRHSVSSAALASADKLRGDGDNAVNRALAFASLVPHLPLDLQVGALAEALCAISHLPSSHEYEDERHRMVTNLVPYIRPRLLSKAVAVAKRGAGFLVFLRLLWLLVRRWLVRIQLIREPSWREYVWSKVSGYLPGRTLESMSDSELLESALATAGSDDDPRSHRLLKARILDDLVFDMPSDLFPEALAAAIDVQSLPNPMRQTTMYGLINLARVWTLTTLGPALAELAKSRPDFAHVWGKELLRFLGTRPRPEFLRVLDALVGFYLTTVEEKKQETAARFFHAIQDVGRWWP